MEGNIYYWGHISMIAPSSENHEGMLRAHECQPPEKQQQQKK